MKKRSYIKLHIVIALSCLAILSFSITKGTRHDSPVLEAAEGNTKRFW
ncbi:MAG: hypothetical protein QXW73_00270 [Nitrososphaerales archaeon]